MWNYFRNMSANIPQNHESERNVCCLVRLERCVDAHVRNIVYNAVCNKTVYITILQLQRQNLVTGRNLLKQEIKVLGARTHARPHFSQFAKSNSIPLRTLTSGYSCILNSIRQPLGRGVSRLHRCPLSKILLTASYYNLHHSQRNYSNAK